MMKNSRQILIENLKKYFSIQELVSEAVYKKWGERAWKFLDEKLLNVLIILRRDILRVPLVCNDWKYGGKNQQRGLRENTSQIVKDKTNNGVMYLSAHNFGKAVDLVSSKMQACEMRKKIMENSFMLPCQIRMEDGVNWLHVDVMTDVDAKDDITLFRD